MDEFGAIVLAGGRSSRMGTPKAGLEWHGSTLLRRAVGLVGRTVDVPVVVVRAAGQELPALPACVEIVQDAHEGRGPLAGIAAGLAVLAGRAETAFVTSTDAPLLHPAFVHHVVRALDGEHDVAVPEAHGHRHPLAAAYRTALAPVVGELVAGRRLRTAALLERCRPQRLDDRALLADPAIAALDPELDSLLNLNEPADYEAARARPAPVVSVRCSGALRREGNPLAARAATLAHTAAAVKLVLDEHVLVTLNGEAIAPDPEVPLATGDAVAFLTAGAGR